MADPETIYNWRRLDGRITTSGQPTEPQLADIHALGVRHIVNLGLHTHDKALPDEAASVGRRHDVHPHSGGFPESDRPGFRAVLLRHGAAKSIQPFLEPGCGSSAPLPLGESGASSAK